jgi:anti-sigma regulatory factor (Ser/Thr protein kinase)
MRSSLVVQVDSSAMRQVDSFVAEFVSEGGIASQESHRILILIEELLTNLVKYGYPDRSEPGRAEIALELIGNRLEIEFIDDGCAFDPFAAPTIDLEATADDRELGGLGLHIVRGMCEETRYERRNDTNVIRLVRVIVSADSG